MSGANRSSGVRDVIDRSKRHIIGLPYDTRRVKRRVKDEQVSSYSMRVHRRRNDLVSNNALLNDRDVDPGEAEYEAIEPPYRPFVKNAATKFPLILVNKILSRGESTLYDKILASVLANQVANGNTELFKELLDSIHSDRRNKIGNMMGRATWRQLVRNPSMRDIPSLPKNDTYMGELALNANSVYRQGTDVFRELLLKANKFLSTIEIGDMEGQQLFNTKSENLMPSSIYPTNQYGIDELTLPLPNFDLSWVYSPPVKKNYKDIIDARFGEGATDIRVNPVGFLPKYRFASLSVGNEGLRNSTDLIKWHQISKILAGFSLHRGDDELFIYPNYGDNELSPYESNLRKKIFGLTSRKPTSLIKQMKSKGIGGYGDKELDIYNKGQFFWNNGLRRIGVDEDLLNGLFPHPLVRQIATEYRDADVDNTIMDKLCSMTLATLPLAPKLRKI